MMLFQFLNLINRKKKATDFIKLIILIFNKNLNKLKTSKNWLVLLAIKFI